MRLGTKILKLQPTHLLEIEMRELFGYRKMWITTGYRYLSDYKIDDP